MFKPFVPPPPSPDDDEIAFEGHDDMPQVAEVAVIGPAVLDIKWRGGGSDKVDVTGVIAENSRFTHLADTAAFAAVRPIEDGHGIAWPEGPDMSARALASMAEIQRGWTGEDFAAWMENMGLSVRGAAEVLDVAPSTIQEQRRKPQIDRVLMLAARALQADRISFEAVHRPRRVGRPSRSVVVVGEPAQPSRDQRQRNKP